MKSNQARVNMDTARDIQHDKTIKTKAEKDRRLKEKQSNNTKVDRPLMSHFQDDGLHRYPLFSAIH